MPHTCDDGSADGHTADSHESDDLDSATSRLGRVIAAASRVPATAPATLASWAGTATDVVNAARTNKGMVTDLVRLEVERVVGALGLVTPTEVVALRKRVSDLERQVARLEATLAQPTRAAAARNKTNHTTTRAAAGKTAAAGRATAQRTAKKAAAKTAKQAAKKAVSRRVVAKGATAAKPAAKKSSS